MQAPATTTETRWEDLDIALEPSLIAAMKKAFGFEYVMPVQKVVVPLFAKSFDVAVEVSTSCLTLSSVTNHYISIQGSYWLWENFIVPHPFRKLLH